MRIIELLLEDRSKACEEKQIAQFVECVRQIRERLGSKNFKIRLGNRELEFEDFVHSQSKHKCDLEIKGQVDGTKQSFFISLKCNLRRGFKWGQFGELNQALKSNFLQDFVNGVKEASDGIMILYGEAYYQMVDNGLIPYVMYGKDYGSKPGINNVDCVWIGDIVYRLDRENQIAEIFGTDRNYYNGDDPEPEDAPVLIARKYLGKIDPEKPSTNNQGIKNCVMEAARRISLGKDFRRYLKVGTPELNAQAKVITDQRRAREGIDIAQGKIDAMTKKERAQADAQAVRDAEMAKKLAAKPTQLPKIRAALSQWLARYWDQRPTNAELNIEELTDQIWRNPSKPVADHIEKLVGEIDYYKADSKWRIKSSVYHTPGWALNSTISRDGDLK